MSASRGTRSGSRVRSMEEEQRVAHANLIHRLADQMEGQDIKAMKEYLLLRRTITGKQREELEGLPAIVNCLEMEMKITIGQRDGYKLLIDALKIIKKDALANEVEQHQKQFCTDGEADKADKTQSQELLTQLASKNETIESLKKENEELRDELSDLKKMGAVAKSEEVKEMRREISNLRGQSRGLQSELDASRKETHQLRSQVEEYKRKLTTKENDYKQLQGELNTTKKEKTELQEELDTTKKKLQEQGQEGGVQGAEGGAEVIQRYQGQEGVQLAKGPRDIERCREVFQKEYGTLLIPLRRSDTDSPC